MKKIAVVLIAFLFVISGCGQRDDKQKQVQMVDNETVVRQQKIATSNSLIAELHRQFKEFDISYYNELSLGIGVVNPKEYHFQMITDSTINEMLEIENIEEQEYIVPIFWKPDYRIFYMPVISVSEKQYEVRVNKNTNLFVQKEEFDFYTWEELLKEQALSVSILTGKGYAVADINSEVLYDAEDSLEVFDFIVEKVEDDWIFVRAELNELEIDKFWVLWRDKNKLLVKPIFLM
ncbi:MAG: hypothetical protein LBG67_04535 [Campylobacteraceae bacterium]|jgi:hypothetical protein|nr:hypothetical protein [Campylobacteraceae bacterium]